MSNLLPDDTEELRLLAQSEDLNSRKELLRIQARRGEDVSSLLQSFPDWKRIPKGEAIDKELLQYSQWDSLRVRVNEKDLSLYQWYDAQVRGDEDVVVVGDAPFPHAWTERHARFWVYLMVRWLMESHRLPQNQFTRRAARAVLAYIKNPTERNEEELKAARTVCNSLKKRGIFGEAPAEEKVSYLFWVLGRNSIWKTTNSFYQAMRSWHLPAIDKYNRPVPGDSELKEQMKLDLRFTGAQNLWRALFLDPSQLTCEI